MLRTLARRALRSSASSTPAAAFSSTASRAIDASKIEITRATTSAPRVPKEELIFGKTFTDHMLEIDWTKEGGWAAPKISPMGTLGIHPAASSLHYGLQCFEGMKAYVDKDGGVRLFRPDKNMERMNTSCSRLFLPEFDGEALTECIKELIRVDRD